MVKLELEPNKRALAIVAHPDDETIWMGGTILRYKRADWTILSVCRASDADRAPKFRRVCAAYGARGEIFDLEDEGNMSVARSAPVIKDLIAAKASGQVFDYIFTHGASGEYGHPRHRGVHRAVRELLDEKALRADKVFFFAYEPAGEHKVMPAKDADFIFKLSDKEFTEKRRIVAEMYGYPYGGIDVGYCTQVEAFKRLFK